MNRRASYGSFGLRDIGPLRVVDAATAIARIENGELESAPLLAYGNGRSYGDSCLNRTGTLIDMRSLNAILRFDPEAGTLEAEAGAMLSDIIAHVAPHGWFPAIVPGTRFITLGGAIANDIHGKNHHRRGSFGHHVESLTLLRSDGSVRACTRGENEDLFAATIGGMGLTGIILSATIRLVRIASLSIREVVTPFANLAEFFDRVDDADHRHEYVVAWVDHLASGRNQGRGLLISGDHASSGSLDGSGGRPWLRIPVRPPVNLLNRWSVRLFNAAYLRAKGRSPEARSTSWRSFFFPLDGVSDWNRLYGPRGLVQHQSVIPYDAAPETVPALLDAAREAKHGSFLTVLKRFGQAAAPGLLCFARPGFTLALDLPNRGERTRVLLDRLDRLTVEAGGAVNPYKDAGMSPATFEASFPRWRALEAHRDPAFVSDFWRRTALRLPRRSDDASHRGNGRPPSLAQHGPASVVRLAQDRQTG